MHKSCQTTPGSIIKCSLSFVLFKNARRIRQKFFLYWKNYLFFKNLCFQQPIRSQRVDLIFPQLMSDYLVDTSKSSLRFVTLNKTRKIGQKFPFTGKIAFFQKLVFSTTSQVPIERSQKPDSNCQTSFWTLIIWFLRFVTLDNSRKRSQKVLSPWKQLFFEMFLSIDFLGPKEFI